MNKKENDIEFRIVKFSASEINQLLTKVENGEISLSKDTKDKLIQELLEQGIEGLQGPMGPAGPQGPKGEQGFAGQDGKSAYEIAIDNGFEGTEEEWLESLKGFNDINLDSKLNSVDSIGTGYIAYNNSDQYRYASGISNYGTPGKCSSTFGYNCLAYGQYSHAEGYYTDAVGKQSHAEGYQSWAKGEGAHAEGYWTEAVGNYSHTEGWYSKSQGAYSHAEGNSSDADGKYSHAEGDRVTASGEAAHAEGTITIASGKYSHAEGSSTNANGEASHAEGQSTEAYGDCQHVQGKYNIADKDQLYAHIVGNGTLTNKSNAHTLDWDGNAWFQGDVFIKGTNQDDGQKLATEDMVIALQQEIAELRTIIEELKNK